jgi:hypothetical protein
MLRGISEGKTDAITSVVRKRGFCLNDESSGMVRRSSRACCGLRPDRRLTS